MTLLLMCELTPPLCRMAADPSVRAAVAALSDDADSTPAELMQALRRHPEEAARMTALLGEPPFPREVLAFFHLCGQCTPEEILSVLTRCTVPPTAEALALLLGEHRRQEAIRRCGLQLLVRLTGDPALPDCSALFPDGPARHANDVIRGLVRRLKEDDP